MDEPVKILFVDDEPNVLNAVRRIFIDDNYEIFTANSAREGIFVMRDKTIQVVVSDYRMPDVNGIEFLREVNEQWPETVRIVLSGYADIASIVAAVNEGQIYKFIPKPWNDDELRITVANAVERYALFKNNKELTVELSNKNFELIGLNKELEKLLAEQTEHLEFRNNVLTAYQKILDSIPAGIIGIDPGNTVVLCNETWTALTGYHSPILDRPVETVTSEEVLRFVRKVRNEGQSKMRTSLSGVEGILSGVAMRSDGEDKGIILAFMREDDL